MYTDIKSKKPQVNKRVLSEKLNLNIPLLSMNPETFEHYPNQ